MNQIEDRSQTPMTGASREPGVVKRSIVIAGHKTSVSLEDAFWKCLRAIAADREMTLSELVALIDKDRQHGNLSSHIRLFVLGHYQILAAQLNTTDETTSSTMGAAPG